MADAGLAGARHAGVAGGGAKTGRPGGSGGRCRGGFRGLAVSRGLRVALGLGVIALGACAAPGDRPGGSDSQGAGVFGGTAWRLVEFQSMDDAQGTTRVDDPALYTMRLGADGLAELRLHCNRATGPWSAEPSADPASGRFVLGPLATTMALCAPPSLGEKIAADAPYVSGYLVRDFRLYLSLMADAGIYVWELDAPDVPASARPDPELVAALLAASPDYARSVLEAGNGTGARYLHSRADLNGDGMEEVFAYLLGPYFCGTGGCNLRVFTPVPGGYALVGDFPITRTPVVIDAVTTGGWRDFWRLESGGGVPASYVRQAFDGERYVEVERVPEDRPPDGLPVLAGEVSFDRGAPLPPGR